jgi:hypothetical protein
MSAGLYGLYDPVGRSSTRSLGSNDPGISQNHAWRHTFKRTAGRAGIERRFRFALCGHASKEEGDVTKLRPRKGLGG